VKLFGILLPDRVTFSRQLDMATVKLSSSFIRSLSRHLFRIVPGTRDEGGSEAAADPFAVEVRWG